MVAAKYATTAINLVSQHTPALTQGKVLTFSATAVSANLSAVSCVDVPKPLLGYKNEIG